MQLGFGEWNPLSEGPGDLVGTRVLADYSEEDWSGTDDCDIKH